MQGHGWHGGGLVALLGCTGGASSRGSHVVGEGEPSARLLALFVLILRICSCIQDDVFNLFFQCF